MHTARDDGGKPCIVHRDFKPADTGFAKAAHAQRGGQRVELSSRRGPCYTPGYADPIIINGGEYSTITDGYAGAA